MIKIALIEVTDFHDECLYSQVKYLNDPNHHITLICNQKLKTRVKNYSGVDQFVFLDLSSKFKKYRAWFKIWRLVNSSFSKVIFNTGEIYIYKLLLFPFKNVELIGVLHNAQKLKRKKQIAISKKLNKYLVLGEFIKKNIVLEKLTNNPIGVFYPIFFPEYDLVLQKPKNEIWISIPGAIELDKRDYRSLYRLTLPTHVKLILLGATKTEASKEFTNKLLQSNLAENIVVFNSFISNETFHSYIRQSDFIMPLIHPNNNQFSDFIKYKITGSYNLAIAYKITMLLEQSFSEIVEYRDCALYYNSQSMNSILDMLDIKKQVYTSDRWSFNYQKETYTNFILSE